MAFTLSVRNTRYRIRLSLVRQSVKQSCSPKCEAVLFAKVWRGPVQSRKCEFRDSSSRKCEVALSEAVLFVILWGSRIKSTKVWSSLVREKVKQSCSPKCETVLFENAWSSPVRYSVSEVRDSSSQKCESVLFAKVWSSPVRESVRFKIREYFIITSETLNTVSDSVVFVTVWSSHVRQSVEQSCSPKCEAVLFVKVWSSPVRESVRFKITITSIVFNSFRQQQSCSRKCEIRDSRLLYYHINFFNTFRQKQSCSRFKITLLSHHFLFIFNTFRQRLSCSRKCEIRDYFIITSIFLIPSGRRNHVRESVRFAIQEYFIITSTVFNTFRQRQSCSRKCEHTFTSQWQL